jgi:hypothetical protein
MKRLLLLLLLFSAPSHGATRIYFGDTSDSYESFAFDAGWETTSGAGRAEMHIGTPLRGRRGGNTLGGITLTANSANQGIDRQLQLRLPSGVAFVSGVTTVSMQSYMAENATTDDVDKCIVGLRVISEGGTVRATLLSVANYGTTGEFRAIGSGFRNKTCADGDTVQASYTTPDGNDFLVLEYGYQTDGTTGASPQGASIASDGSGYASLSVTTSGDCAVNDTDTTACTPWLELSNTFSAATDPGPVTRFWLPSDTAADVSPAINGWSESNEAVYRKLVMTKGSTAMADGQTVDMTCGSFCTEVDREYISDPLAAGIVFTQGVTTVKGALMVRYVTTTDDILGVTFRARIVSEDGTTQRVSLLSAVISGYHEISGTSTVKALAVTVPVVNTYTTVEGDRLAVSMGFAVEAAGTTPQGIARYGEDAAFGDCPAGVFTGTTDCAGWVEFSNSITEPSDARPPIIISSLAMYALLQ